MADLAIYVVSNSSHGAQEAKVAEVPINGYEERRQEEKAEGADETHFPSLLKVFQAKATKTYILRTET